jgi:hypothetical protein
MNESLAVEGVRTLMLRAWDNVDTFYVVAKAQFYNVGDEDGPNPHPPWRFLQPATLLALPGADNPWVLRAWWAAPHSWRYMQQNSAGVQVEYVTTEEKWAYRVNGVAQVEGLATKSDKNPVPTFDVGNPRLNPEQNRDLCWWITPQAWVESMHLQVLWKGSIRGRHLYHLVAHPDRSALRSNRGLFASLQDDERIFGGYLYQLWVDEATGFFYRIAAEADNGRAWDIIVDTLVFNQPMEEGVFE